MIPKTGEDLRQDFVFRTLPSHTFRLNHTPQTITGTVDQIQAVEQAIYLILNTERYHWLIHSWNYGVELYDLIGKDIEYCIPEIERRIREALLQDDRITAVENFQFTVNKKQVLATFTAVSIFWSSQRGTGGENRIMYEHITYEELVKRMINRALESNKNLDSREGSILWLAEAPAAVELQNLYIALDNVLRETFADTASREYLILRARERGLSPIPASAAVLEMTITPATLRLEIGERFSIGDLNYYVSAEQCAGVYEITCETSGEAGNDYTGTIIPIEYIPGLESCQITARLIPGEDEESTEAFRQRYFDSLNRQAFGGNRADYIQKVNALPGVGGVKVYRAWNGQIAPATLIPPTEAASWMAGLPTVPLPVLMWLQTVFEAGKNSLLTVGGTVKLVIIDSTFCAPSDALVQQVQTAIDPIQNAGEGAGLAPIGHVVKVFPVGTQTLDLTFSPYYKRGWDWEAVKPYAEEAVRKYFKELAEGWAAQEEELIVRISQLESRLLNVTGILDVAQTTINGMAENSVLPQDTIPVLGSVRAAAIAGV